MFSLNYYNPNVSHKLNKFNIKGIMVEGPIQKGDIICQFPINILVISDNKIFKNMKQMLSGIVPDDELMQFSLAVHILYHPNKYQYILDYIYKNYSPYKPFLFRDEEMKIIKNTMLYNITNVKKLHFNIMMVKYIEIDNDITYISEQKLKILYSFCCAYSHAILLSDYECKCIDPGILINNVTKGAYKPLLNHAIENDKWTIRANRDYNIGEEIIDYLGKTYDIKHPNYPSLILNDWKLSTAVTRGMVYDILDSNTSEFNYRIDDSINEDKIKMIDQLYNNIDLDEMKVDMVLNDENDKSKQRYKKCLEVAINILTIEKNYYKQFKKNLKDKQTDDINIEIQ